MSRISEAFDRCKTANRAAFIPFIMGGDPSSAKTSELLEALAKNGADIIELGIPFSDPVADGPTIQAAGLRALENGTGLAEILIMAATFRKQHETPLVLMGYLNPIYVYGYEKFAADAAAAGVDGIIIVDLPPEEAAEIEPLLRNHAIALVRLIAPTSVPGRLPLLTQHADGYLYYISITGITGGAAAPTKRIAEHIAAIRGVTTLPVCVGFGVKTPDDVKAMATLADGVVVGSAIVQFIHQSGGDIKKVSEFLGNLAAGCCR